MYVVEVYWDPNGRKGGKQGCWRARMKGRHGVHDAGVTQDAAIEAFLLTAKSMDLPGDRDDWEIEEL